MSTCLRSYVDTPIGGAAFRARGRGHQESRMPAEPSSTEQRSNPDGRRGMSVLAWAYLILIAISAMLVGWLSLGQVTPIDTKTWVAFGLIAVGAALAQLFP